MKIAVFGKSGPRLVTIGLVTIGLVTIGLVATGLVITGFVTAGLGVASAAAGPRDAQAAVASRNNPKNILDKSILPDRSCFAVTYHDAGRCRVPLIGLNLTRRGRDFKPARQRAIYGQRSCMTRAGD